MPKIILTRSLENLLGQNAGVPYQSPDEKRNEALTTIRSRFGSDDVLVIARTLISLSTHEVKHGLYDKCCVHHDDGEVAAMAWTCFTALHHDLAHQFDEIASVVRELGKHFGLTKNTTYATLAKAGIWHSEIKARFSLSTLEPTWRVRRKLMENKLESLEILYRVLKPQLEQIDPVFEQYIEVLKVGIERIISSVQTGIEVLNRREMVMEDACHNGFAVDPPDLESGLHYYSPLLPPSYWPRWGTPTPSITSKPYIPPPLSPKERILQNWERFQRFLGYTMPMAVIMSMFCTFGIVATTLAVYKCASSDHLPAIDSNFWSALAQSNIAIAAIYSIIVPQLQGQPHPIPPRWRWIFTSLLVLSVSTAVVATCVYPWHGRTSIVAAFVSSTSQLAVTLHMILAAGRKIKNLQSEVELLRSAPRKSGKR